LGAAALPAEVRDRLRIGHTRVSDGFRKVHTLQTSADAQTTSVPATCGDPDPGKSKPYNQWGFCHEGRVITAIKARGEHIAAKIAGLQVGMLVVKIEGAPCDNDLVLQDTLRAAHKRDQQVTLTTLIHPLVIEVWQYGKRSYPSAGTFVLFLFYFPILGQLAVLSHTLFLI
jgi:hypothetical protein